MRRARVHEPWNTLSEPSEDQHVASAMGYNGQLLAICDLNNDGESEGVQAYNPATDTWSEVCHMEVDGEFQAVVARETE